MRAEAFPGPLVPPLVEEIEVEVSERGPEAVRVTERVVPAAGVGDREVVGANGARGAHLEQPELLQDGRAEETGLADAAANGVLAAQAFHWFVADIALREFHRILRPEGWVVLMWNERDEQDPATAAYGSIVGAGKEAAAVEGPRRQARQALHRSPLFLRAEQRLFGHAQEVDEEGLLGRAFSASYAPKDAGDRQRFAAALRDVFARFQQDGTLQLKYVTSVDVAQRGQ